MPYAGDDGRTAGDLELEELLKELADRLKIRAAEWGKYNEDDRARDAVKEALKRFQ